MDARNSIKLTAPGQSLDAELIPFVTPYTKELGRRYHRAMIICPGGAYSHLSGREGFLTALRFQAYGIQTFVLRYSVLQPFPKALVELASAIACVRKRHEEWDIDPEQIYVCGFSAGGHLAVSLGVYWHEAGWRKLFDQQDMIRPAGLLLCYPLITAFEYTHQESIRNLTGRMEDGKALEAVSLERHIGEHMPPVFVWHTADDELVPVENSLLLVTELQRYHIPYEAHILPEGGHGLALADEVTAETERQIDPRCGAWVQWALEWMKRRKS